MAPSLHLVRTSFPGRPAFDTAVSRAILERVEAGELPETLRLARPGAMVAFGKMDTKVAGYPAAAQAARAGGFEAVERLAGGRAAVFHERTLAFAHAVPDADPRRHTHRRFERTAALIREALGGLGVDARVGEVPGEYCPGGYSVNARGRTKVMGIGQRLLRGAAHTGGVIVVGDGDRVRAILERVYPLLALGWDPATSGSVEDEVGPVADLVVAEAVLAAYRRHYEIVEAELDPVTLARAEALWPEHRSPDAAAAAA